MISMLEYVRAIQRKLIDQYGFPENPEMPGCPLGRVPNGTYPMEIYGRIDYVEVRDGKLRFGNFESPCAKVPHASSHQ